MAKCWELSDVLTWLALSVDLEALTIYPEISPVNLIRGVLVQQ